MRAIDYFARTCVINLPERSDRRKAMTQELAAAGMPLKPGKVEIFPGIRPDDAGGFSGIGVRGCFLSHLSILKQAQKDGLANILIMEDDLTISKRFKADQEKLINQLAQTDWGFVYFGHTAEVEETTSPATFQPYSQPMVTAHFYAINGTIVGQLIDFLEALLQRPPGHPDGGPMHLDGAYSTFRERNPEILTLIAVPNLGWQRSSRSDIAPNSWYDRTPVFKQLVGVARAGKSWLKGN
jgi:glycosyl transferase family 25